MTKLLDRAITEVQKLSDAEQDAIAALILDRISDDEAWERSFARSQNQLAAMAQRAREQVRTGRSRDLGSPPSMNSRVTEDFMLCYARLPANVREQARRAYRLWRSNPSHPGIQSKRIHSAEFKPALATCRSCIM